MQIRAEKTFAAVEQGFCQTQIALPYGNCHLATILDIADIEHASVRYHKAAVARALFCEVRAANIFAGRRNLIRKSLTILFVMLLTVPSENGI